MVALKAHARRVDFDLYNHGQDGLITQFKTFVADHKARESERDKQHKSNRARLNIIIAILGTLALYLALVHH